MTLASWRRRKANDGDRNPAALHDAAERQRALQAEAGMEGTTHLQRVIGDVNGDDWTIIFRNVKGVVLQDAHHAEAHAHAY